MMKKRLLLIFSLLVFSHLISAQTSTASSATQFDTTGFPQWAKDLRRAEIIAFGVFPFAYFIANFSYDSYRWSNQGFSDMRYAPWPLKGEGAIEQTQEEKFRVIGIAAGTAVLISLIDYSIERYKRNQKEKERISLPEGTPIIIRRPLNPDEGSVSDSDSSN